MRKIPIPKEPFIARGKDADRIISELNYGQTNEDIFKKCSELAIKLTTTGLN